MVTYPQSKNSQSSPVPGTYQMSEGPETLDVHPVRSVLARAKGAIARARAAKLYMLILITSELIEFVVSVVRCCMLMLIEKRMTVLNMH